MDLIRSSRAESGCFLLILFMCHFETYVPYRRREPVNNKISISNSEKKKEENQKTKGCIAERMERNSEERDFWEESGRHLGDKLETPENIWDPGSRRDLGGIWSAPRRI